MQKCSFGCVEGMCPQYVTRPSYNKLMADPCKKCDGQSRCENSGICHTLPPNATQDEKFVCDCPEPFHGKYCGRWGKWYLIQLVMSHLRAQGNFVVINLLIQFRVK